MILLGTIILTQVQKKSLKVGGGSQRKFDPSPIAAVPQIKITSHGVMGLTDDGDQIIDIHNAHHPESRNRGNANGLSINFLSNYERIQSRFPDTPLKMGMGGENLVLKASSEFSIEQIDTKLELHTKTGKSIPLVDVIAIPPCAPFSNYLAGKELNGEKMRSTLEFLADGTRGFYATLDENMTEAIIEPGDKLYAI